MSNMITAETILTLRRRLIDNLCKDNFFALDVIGYAIRENKLRYHDLVTEEGAELLKGESKSSTMKVMNTHHKEDGYTVYYTAADDSFMATDEDGMVIFPPPKEVNTYL